MSNVTKELHLVFYLITYKGYIARTVWNNAARKTLFGALWGKGLCLGLA